MLLLAVMIVKLILERRALYAFSSRGAKLEEGPRQVKLFYGPLLRTLQVRVRFLEFRGPSRARTGHEIKI